MHSEFDPPFDVVGPSAPSAGVVWNSPHSGRVYPRWFVDQAQLAVAALRRSEDTFVDVLFAGVAERGMPLLSAHFPRSMVDVNREPYELDPRMFDGRLPSYANTRSIRVAGGLGTVPRVVGDGQEIYGRRLPIQEAMARIDGLYKPYHRALRRLIAQAHRQFGGALLIDCHSMPSLAASREDKLRADIVIGDRFGTSCDPAVSDMVETTLRARGYVVARNKPYAGGYITEHYGQPQTGVHAIQIEINRAIYMDERSYEPLAHFEQVRADMMTLADAALAYDLARRGEWKIAAE